MLNLRSVSYINPPPIYFYKNPAGKAKTGNENMFCFFFFFGGGGGGAYNYCLNTNSLDWLVRAT